MNGKLKYNPGLKPLARELRKDGTKGEALLWKKVLRAKNMEGYQFNRQFAIGNFIVDFICRRLKLIIEIDGGSHLSKGPGIEKGKIAWRKQDIPFYVSRRTRLCIELMML